MFISIVPDIYYYFYCDNIIYQIIIDNKQVDALQATLTDNCL